MNLLFIFYYTSSFVFSLTVNEASAYPVNRTVKTEISKNKPKPINSRQSNGEIVPGKTNLKFFKIRMSKLLLRM